MGFRVQIDDLSAPLLNRLRERPSEVFNKPFVGYILFLAGGTDQDILAWLSENVVALDSLTAEIIAFAVFARSFKIKLRTPPYQDTRGRSETRTEQVPLQEIRSAQSIDALVKRGTVGWIFDGDEINAITYAVDEIARDFGVLNDLPCMLLLDAVPKEEVEIISLDSNVTKQLFPLMRLVIQRLLDSPDHDLFIQTIHAIVQSQRDLNNIQNRLSSLERRKDLAFRKSDAERVRRTLAEVRASLLEGSAKKAISAISNKKNWHEFFFDQEDLEKLTSSIRDNHAVLVSYKHTVLRMYLYETQYKWPLEEPWRSKYLAVYHKHIRKLIGEVSDEPELDSPEQCKELRQRLLRKQNLLVDQIMGILPADNDLKKIAAEVAQEKGTQLDIQLNELRKAKKGANLAMQEKIEALHSMTSMSFTRAFVKELRKLDLETKKRRVREGARIFAGSWLNPEVLVKVWKALASTP